jgi:hypothetical protein
MVSFFPAFKEIDVDAKLFYSPSELIVEGKQIPFEIYLVNIISTVNIFQ